MSRYIDIEPIEKQIEFELTIGQCKTFSEREQGVLNVYDAIKNAPTADVEEVRHGKWEHGREVHREYIGDALLAICYDKWWCSQCHYTIDDHHYSKITYKRCPECGAHMDKEKEG